MIQKTFTFCAIDAIPLTIDGSKRIRILSARARTQMAEAEQAASESDPVFQALMTEAMNHFEAKEFDQALNKFEEAGKKRPINVYPPVMAEDVKLAMANQPEEEEVAEEPAPIEEIKDKTPKLTAEERVEMMYQQELAKVYNKMPDDSKNEELAAVNEELQKSSEREQARNSVEGLTVRSREEILADGGVEIETEELTESTVIPQAIPLETEEPAKAPPVKTIKEVQEELAADYADGITEEEFKEGNRNITKRVVVKDGVGNEYRKVRHAWGGVFYFKNGTSITERVWKEDTVKH